MAKGESLRRRVYDLLDEDAVEKSAAWRIINYALIALIIISVGAAIVGTMQSFPARFVIVLWVIEYVTVACFTVEYIARVWSSVEDRDGRYENPISGRIRFMLTPMAIVDLVAVLPLYLYVFFNLNLVVLRLFRLLRILKITRYSPALTTFELVVYNERRSMGSALIIILVLLIIAAAILHSIERHVQPDAFGSIPASLWWAVITLSTVGYGDVTPITTLGKFVAGILSILGIGMFAIPTAILGAGFARELQKQSFIDMATMVARSPSFKELSPAQLAEITALLVPRDLPARYTITRAGDVVDSVYWIDHGKISFRGPHGRRIMSAGDSFGGLAILEGHSTEISAKTLSPCRILELNAKDFLRLLENDPELKERTLQELHEHRKKLTPH